MTPRDTALLVGISLFALPVSQGLATGNYWPARWLDNGGIAVDYPPEFYWELEVRKLAVPFKPTETRVLPGMTPAKDNQPETQESTAEQARRLDRADFEEALKQGRLKPADPAAALQRHLAARQAIEEANETTTHSLPQEEPSEFADYHRGAFAFHRGVDHYNEARAAWLALLKRPAAERHYRSVWAAFMLGKLDLFAGKADAWRSLKSHGERATGSTATSPPASAGKQHNCSRTRAMNWRTY
jgi:hypothetical protein